MEILSCKDIPSANASPFGSKYVPSRNVTPLNIGTLFNGCVAARRESEDALQATSVLLQLRPLPLDRVQPNLEGRTFETPPIVDCRFLEERPVRAVENLPRPIDPAAAPFAGAAVAFVAASSVGRSSFAALDTS